MNPYESHFLIFPLPRPSVSPLLIRVFSMQHLPSLVSKYQLGKLSAGKALGPFGDLDFCALHYVLPGCDQDQQPHVSPTSVVVSHYKDL